MKILFKQQEKSGISLLGIRDCYVKTLTTKRDRRSVTTKQHNHKCFELHILLEGYERYDVAGRQLDIRPGEFLLISPDTPHCLLFSHEQTRKYALCFCVDVILTNTWYTDPVPNRLWDRIAFLEEESSLQTENGQQLMGNAAGEIIVSILRMAGLREKKLIHREGENVTL